MLMYIMFDTMIVLIFGNMEYLMYIRNVIWHYSTHLDGSSSLVNMKGKSSGAARGLGFIPIGIK